MSTNARAAAGARSEVSVRSVDETRELGAAMARAARPGDRIALLGPLGAGKTQLAKGFAVGLGVTDVVNSPSFTLMAEYAGRLPLFHQDLYRLNDAEDVLGGGLVDERQLDGVTLIEWGERLPDEIDPSRVVVRIAVGDGDERSISVESPDENGQRYIDAATEWGRR